MAFNRLADSQSKQLAALSVEHGGDTALTVNIGVSDGGREGNPQSQRSPPQSDSASGLGSSPKAARRASVRFSAHTVPMGSTTLAGLHPTPLSHFPGSELLRLLYRGERVPCQADICRQSPVGRVLSSGSA